MSQWKVGDIQGFAVCYKPGLSVWKGQFCFKNDL